jgi:hypothetical protein
MTSLCLKLGHKLRMLNEDPHLILPSREAPRDHPVLISAAATMVDPVLNSAAANLSQQAFTLVQQISSVANRVKLNKKQSKSLERYVLTLNLPLQMRTCSPEACNLVMKELNQIQEFLMQFDPSQPWFKRLMLWANSSEIKKEFVEHQASLDRLMRAIEFTDRPEKQYADAHTAHSSAHHAPISTLPAAPTMTPSIPLQSNTPPSTQASIESRNLQQAIRTTVVNSAVHRAPIIAIASSNPAACSSSTTQPKLTATVPPRYRSMAGESSSK